MGREDGRGSPGLFPADYLVVFVSSANCVSLCGRILRGGPDCGRLLRGISILTPSVTVLRCPTNKSRARHDMLIRPREKQLAFPSHLLCHKTGVSPVLSCSSAVGRMS